MKNKIFYGICILFVIIALTTKKSNKPYHSSVYSSWEEERIDELEADVAYLMDKLDKKKY